MEAGSGTPPERRGVERSSGGGEQGGRKSGGRPGKTEGGGAVREKNLYPRAGGDFQLLQKQLPLLWNPLRQQPGVPLPADGGGDPVLRRGGLSAWISHLCAPGRGGRVLYRRTALRDSGGIEKTISGLRGYPFSGGTHQGELRAAVCRGGGPLSAPPRDRGQRSLQPAAPSGNVLGQPDALPVIR